MLKIYFTEQISSIGNIILGMVDDKIFWVSLNNNGDRFRQYISSLEKNISMKTINKNPKSDVNDNPLVLRLLKSKSLSIVKEKKPFDQVLNLINRYFNSESVDFSRIPTIYLSGTAFQHKVWNVLKLVSWGELKFYKDIAEIIGCPGSSRAVGNANGRNNIPLIIPCHRIIKSDGRLGGYSGGLDIKKKLLQIEKNHIDY